MRSKVVLFLFLLSLLGGNLKAFADDSKITFIIPSVNRPSLKYSVQSLLNQTNPNWKCIIIYDGVEGPTFSDERITTMKIDKIGVSGQAGLVRNKGLTHVETEWIGFLDDDDTLSPDYVKLLFEKYANYDVVVWRMELLGGSVLPYRGSDHLRSGCVGISFCFKNKFDLQFGDNNQYEDFFFLEQLTQMTPNYTVTPEIGYYVRH